MARINTNIASLVARNNLAQTNADLTTRLQRLSTGLRINRGADGPAALIVSERLRSEIRGTSQAIANSERASSVIATTEGYLNEVADLLNSVKALVIEAANTGGVSQEEIEANQLQVDSAIESITRISNTASFAGLQLLNGSLEYYVSGVANSAINDLSVFGAQFGNNTSVPVSVEVVASAQTAMLFLSSVSSGGLPAGGTLLSSVTLEIAGNAGVQTLSFVSGTEFDNVITAINTLKESTGVSASLAGGDTTSGINLNSMSYGSDQFVSVRKIGEGGDFLQFHPEKGDATVIQRDEGQDVSAVVNGALAVGSGLEVELNTPSLSIELFLSAVFAQTTGVSKSFYITGGGVNFQLGPSISATQQVGFGIQSIAASRLGGTTIDEVRYFLGSVKSGQTNSLIGGNAQSAAQILESAITDISQLRGRLGSLERNTIQTNIRALQIGLENITASESEIRDADFAEETAALTRAQILASAGTSVLAMANTQAQSVLALLG